MKKKLISNSLFGVGQALINILLVFFTIPIFIKMLGSELYGIFSLIMVIGSLNSLSNLGLNNALVKFVAEQGKSEETEVDIFSSLIMVFAVIVPVTFTAIYFNKFIILSILNVPNHLYLSTKFFFIWVVLANGILLVGQIFKAILDGLQIIHITSLQQLIYNIFYWGLICLSVWYGYGLTEVGISIFLASIIWFIISLLTLVKVWGIISFRGFKGRFRKSAKKQLKYGLTIYSGGLISFFYEPLSKVLISHFLGVSEVGFFDIAMRLKGQIWGVILKLFYPLFPFISEQKDLKIIRNYVHNLEQKMFLLVIPVIVGVILTMKSFISLWIGNNVEIISITSIFIICFHLAGSSTVIPNYQFLLAKNLASKTVLIQLSNVFFNSVVFLLFVNIIGYNALILSNVIAIMSSFVMSLYFQKKYLDSLIFDTLGQFFKIVLAFLILLIIGYFARELFISNNLLILFLVPLILMIITPFLYKIFGLVNKSDIHRYFGKNNKFSKLLVLIYNK